MSQTIMLHLLNYVLSLQNKASMFVFFVLNFKKRIGVKLSIYLRCSYDLLKPTLVRWSAFNTTSPVPAALLRWQRAECAVAADVVGGVVAAAAAVFPVDATVAGRFDARENTTLDWNDSKYIVHCLPLNVTIDNAICQMMWRGFSKLGCWFVQWKRELG